MASWYDKNFSHRASIMVDNHGGTNPTDFEVAIPTDFPEFWGVVQSSGNDVYVTMPDGFNLLTFKLHAWDYADKSGHIHVDNAVADSTAAALAFYVYWGNPNATSAQTAFTVSSPKVGTIETDTAGTGSAPVIPCMAEAIGATNPRFEVGKASTEDIYIWWDLSRVLSQRRVPYNNRKSLEGVDNVRYVIQSAGQGQTQTAMVDNAGIRKNGEFIRTTIKGGSSGTNYVAILTVVTTTGRVLDFRCTIRVNDVTAPT